MTHVVSPLYIRVLRCNVNVNYTTQNYTKLHIQVKIENTHCHPHLSFRLKVFVHRYINCHSEVTDIVQDMLKNPFNVV